MLALELLSRTGTSLGFLDGLVEGSVGWSKTRVRRYHDDGQGGFTIPNDHPRYADVTEPAGFFRLVRCYIDPPASPTPADASFLWVIHRDPRTRLAQDGEQSETTLVRGSGGMSLLGLGEYHAGVVLGYRNTGRRTFGWVAPDYEATEFTSMPTSGGQQRNPRLSSRRGRPDGWVDPLAEWFWTNSGRTGSMWVRHDLSGYTGRARLFAAGRGTFWLDGDEVLVTDTTVDFQRTDLDLDESLLALRFDGEVIYTLVELDADGELGDVLFRSTTGATFSEARNTIQTVVLDPDTPPFPWGSSYPSTGGSNLQGTFRLSFRGQTTPATIAGGALEWDATASDVEDALEALSTVGSGNVTVSGSGTSSSPWVVEVVGTLAGANHPQMGIIHTDLRHNHATTRVRVTQTGRSLDTSTPGADAISATGTEPDGITYGYVMRRLIAEMQALGGLSAITVTMTDDVDHNGTPWTVRLPIVSYRDGEQVGQVAVQGCQQFAVDCEVTPTLVFAGYDSFGVDRSGTVELTDGTGLAAAANVESEAPKATVVRIGTSGGYGWATDAGQVAAFGWRATSATYGLAETPEEVQTAANELLDDLRGAVRQTVLVGEPPQFDVGDYVAVRTADGGTYLPYRVEAISPTEVDGGNVEFDVDLERLL